MSKEHNVSQEQAEELVNKLYVQSSKEEPPAALDDAIMAKARAGVAPESETSTKSMVQMQRWQRFGSLAATVVVVVTIGLIYHDNRSQLVPETPLLLESETAPAAPRQEAADVDAQAVEKKQGKLAEELTLQEKREQIAAEPALESSPESAGFSDREADTIIILE